MEAPQGCRALARGVIDLCPNRIEALLPENLITEHPGEEAAMVLMPFRIDKIAPIQACFSEEHLYVPGLTLIRRIPAVF